VGVVHAPDSAFAKAMVQWEARDGVLGPAGRPYVKREYPMMLHKAAPLPAGGLDITETQIVYVERERTKYEAMGFRATPLEALAVLDQTQTEHATLAAERNFEVRRMSAKAQAEVAAAEEAAGAVHLPTIPETPIGPRRMTVLTERDVQETLQRNADEALEAQQAELVAQRAEIERLTAELAAKPKPRRGRPKKAATVEG
jgi:hypothetical protein